MDRFGCSVRALRRSITGRCNLRCWWCMPTSGREWMPRAHVLTHAAITCLTRMLAGMGVTEPRLTGGESLLRPDLSEIVQDAASIPDI